MREDFGRQLDAKNENIKELNQKISDLKIQIDQLQSGKSSGSAGGQIDQDKLAAAVADAVAKEMASDKTLAAIQSSIDRLSQGPKSPGNTDFHPKPAGAPESKPATPPPAATPKLVPSGNTNAPIKDRFDFAKPL